MPIFSIFTLGEFAFRLWAKATKCEAVLFAADANARRGIKSSARVIKKRDLSLLKIISERNNDAIRTELASRQWFRIVAPLEVSVSL